MCLRSCTDHAMAAVSTAPVSAILLHRQTIAHLNLQQQAEAPAAARAAKAAPVSHRSSSSLLGVAVAAVAVRKHRSS
jgi:hypothetical protein